MSRFLVVGDTIADAITVTSSAGVAADPGSGPTVAVTLPDLTSASATVTKTATGAYTATLVSSQVGRHVLTWAASGANSSDFPHVSVFDVHAADPRFLIGLDDARAALNMAATQRADDEELRGLLAAATIVVERIIGPVVAGTQVDTLSGRGLARLDLSARPTSITTVTEDAVGLTEGTDFVVDEIGQLWRGSTPGAGRWSSVSPRNVVVTYAIGSGIVPDNVREAARYLIRHWWTQQQQSYYVNGAPEESYGPLIAGYAVPNMVVDLLAGSDRRLVGIA